MLETDSNLRNFFFFFFESSLVLMSLKYVFLEFHAWRKANKKEKNDLIDIIWHRNTRRSRKMSDTR